MNEQLDGLLKELGADPVDIPAHLVARYIRALPNNGEYRHRVKEATAAGKSFARQRKYSETRLNATVEFRQELELERILADILNQQQLLKSLGIHDRLPSKALHLTIKDLRGILV